MSATLNLKERTEIGGGKVKRFRKLGYVPGVLYGKSIGNKVIGIKQAEFRNALKKYGRNAVFNAKINGEEIPVLIKDIQEDIIKNDLLHVDLHQIRLDQAIEVTVPIKLIGRELVESTGKIVVQMINEVDIECLPQDTPAYIEADITNMNIGDKLTAGELKLPGGIKLLSDPEEIVVSVVEPIKAEATSEESEETTED